MAAPVYHFPFFLPFLHFGLPLFAMFFSRRRPEGQRASRPRRSLSETIKFKLCLPL
jgi:hypothetical protein